MKKYYISVVISLLFFSNSYPMMVEIDQEIKRLEKENARLYQEIELAIIKESKLKKKFKNLDLKMKDS